MAQDKSKAYAYDVIRDYGVDPEDSTIDSVSGSAHALIAVWQQKYPATFSRAGRSSFDDDAANAVALRDGVPLQIWDDIETLSAQSSKGSPIHQFSANLRPGMNYLTEIYPGDHVAVWIVNDQVALRDIRKRLKKGDACNGFMDGLKFFGKINQIQKQLVQGPDGTRATVYSVSGASFTEFDSAIYYNPYLPLSQAGLATEILRGFGLRINELFENEQPDKKRSGGISGQKAIPALLNVFFGKGVPKNYDIVETRDSQRLKVPLTLGADSNSFLIPKEAASIFGVKSGSKPGGRTGWIDVMETLLGIQDYQTYTAETTANGVGAAIESYTGVGFRFAPFLHGAGVAGVRETGKDLVGTFIPSTGAFSGKNVWGILNQFLNRAVNEAYTTLRVNEKNEVVPTLVVRQLPFSSDILPDKEVTIKTPVGEDKTFFVSLTRYSTLPQWRIHPILIKGFSVSRSDAMRMNMVQVLGESGNAPGGLSAVAQLAYSPPVMDNLDVLRSGLRIYERTVSCAPEDTVLLRGSDWMYILSDILMGQHLLLSGGLTCRGIVSPICIGDNLELDGTIFHIEDLTHHFQAQADGNKSFTTTLGLTHGMAARQVDGRDATLYIGSSVDDLKHHDAPATTDSKVPRPDATLPSEGVLIVADDIVTVTKTPPKVSEPPATRGKPPRTSGGFRLPGGGTLKWKTKK